MIGESHVLKFYGQLLEDGGASGGKISWSCYQENMP
jgi:hypothetical protein